ncbi:MAG TPA: alpha/beta hydrolase [Gammaproteobacteria bacterium]
MRNLRKVSLAAVIAGLAYLAGITALWAFQRDLMYFPGGEPRVAPSYYAMLDGVQEVSFTTADGLTLVAWYAPAPPDRPTVVMFHGNGGSLRGERYRLKRFKDAQIGALLLAYRGYSGNAGVPSEQGLYADARAALDWLERSGVASTSIVLYGISLGTGVATKMAAEREFAAVVLESPYTSTVDVAAWRFPIVPVAWLMEDRFESLARIRAITEPLLIMHGDADAVIPQQFGRQLFEAANQPKEGFWPHGLGHNDIFDNGGCDVALDFIRRRLSVAE